MQIQSGKLYENRTWKYLYPSLKYYGDELMNNLAVFFKLAIGVRDMNTKESNCLFILIDTEISKNKIQEENYKKKFATFLEWLKDKEYYVKDYMYEDNSGKHMVVLKLPNTYKDNYLHFIKGEYSEMYTDKAINHYFKYISISNKITQQKINDRIKKTKFVLKKDKAYLEDFVKIVNTRFNTNVSSKYFEKAELDFPPNKEEEIFNYKKRKNDNRN